ncbi:MAG: amino acid adenylation domain-containing protein, partial [Phormidesmis sp.]
AAGSYISGKLEYRQDLFSAGTIEAMSEAFCTLLDSITLSPKQSVSKLSIVSEKQKQQLQQWNNTARDYPTGLCLHQLFEQQVARSPQAQALITPSQTLSYQQLNVQANQLARQLQDMGIAPDARIGICLDRTASLIVSILAVLKAGGAYVPLDPNYPTSRLSYILEDAQVSVIITQPEYAAIAASAPHIIVLDPRVNPQNTVSKTLLTNNTQPNNLAYIIYTSGSTGKPKGVAIEHRSPVALVQWATKVFSPTQLSGVLAATSICFDLSIFEIFVPLSSGGSIVLAEDVLQLPDLPAAEHVTLINTVPTAIAQLLRIQGIPNSVSTVNLAGEPISPTIVQQLYDLSSVQQVYNLYGPSEDTTYSTYALLSPEETVAPIGKPIANTQTYVLDEQNNPVPVGMPGELYLAGEGLARGYWNQPELTAERFVNGLYKTGDRVRYRPNGQLEFLGRMDAQVKIRGFRIELGEIESVLLQHSQVVQAAVKPWVDAQDNQRLAAYIVLAETLEEIAFGEALAIASKPFEALRTHLQNALPSYMLPAAFIPLKALPLLPNGKINRKALPQPVLNQLSSASNKSLTPTEQILVDIWQSLLGQTVGIHDNFFELGGDSILAIQAIAQAQNSGLYFSPKDLFQYSTVSQLAGIATTQVIAQAQQTPIVGTVPLTPIQHWFFSQRLASPHHWNQSVLLTVKQALNPEILEQALQKLMYHHDALRATFKCGSDGWQQVYNEPSETTCLEVVRRSVEDVGGAIATESAALQQCFDLQNGPLLKVAYYELKTAAGLERRLLLICHHLIIDGISWRILLGDLQSLYQQLDRSPSENALLPPKTLSTQHWANQLKSADFTLDLPYWKNVVAAKSSHILPDFPQESNLMGEAATVSVSLSATETTQLLQEVPKAYSARIDDMLLTALLLALAPVLKYASNQDTEPSLRLWLEGHGRPDEQNLSRTVGWLTVLYPVLLTVPQ